ncbi:MAG: response regulator, partial [Candidatus Marinimicrobia bacterium]|nr:response regulator [Candidatus Neomarinimicrobiota bacterium]
DYLEKVDKSAQSLLGIINDILDFSKMESGKLNIETIKFDLDQVFENIANLNAGKAQAKGLEFSLHISKEVPLYLIGDPLRIGQIITNYCSNAIKFTEKGEILVRVDLGEKLNNGKLNIIFSVKDTGIGLSEDQQSRMFQEFSQADGSITRKYGGTGLGLAISRQLAELMGGKTWLESKLGQGSTFYFSVILDSNMNVFGQNIQEEKTRINEDSTYEHKLKTIAGKRILLAEDNEINQVVAAELLEDVGFIVDIASNGQEAFDMLLASGHPSKYSLIFMDLQMPVMDGFATTEAIRKISQYDDLPIVAMTADAMAGIREKCLTIGMNDMVTKPIDTNEVFASLLQWIKPEDYIPLAVEQTKNVSLDTHIDIPDLPGIDIEGSLARFRGNKVKYVKILKEFRKSYVYIASEIQAEVKSGFIEDAIRSTHMIKGVAGNIGMTDIFKIGNDLEIALKNNNLKHVDKLIDKLSDAIEEIIRILDERLPDVKQLNKIEMDSIDSKIDPKLYSKEFSQLADL